MIIENIRELVMRTEFLFGFIISDSSDELTKRYTISHPLQL